MLLPSVFQHCKQEGSRTGCLYNHDAPDEQCSSDRKGYMCGQCRTNGSGVDLTLRSCKKCNVGDAVGLTIICRSRVVA